MEEWAVRKGSEGRATKGEARDTAQRKRTYKNDGSKQRGAWAVRDGR